MARPGERDQESEDLNRQELHSPIVERAGEDKARDDVQRIEPVAEGDAAREDFARQTQDAREGKI